MPPTDTVEIRYGRVVHVHPCDCENGKVVACRHGANCDCPGKLADCSECDGRGELVDEDCCCPRCLTLFRALENHRHAELH